MRKAGIMVKIQNTTHLTAINTHAFTKCSLGNALIAHLLIDGQFHGNLRWERDRFLSGFR